MTDMTVATTEVVISYRNSTAYDRIHIPRPAELSAEEHVKEVRNLVWKLFNEGERFYLDVAGADVLMVACEAVQRIWVRPGVTA